MRRRHLAFRDEIVFTTIEGERPGLIAGLLRESYADLLKADPRWESQLANWDAYDAEVFSHPDTVGACLFLTRVKGRVAGFGSWDPRQAPDYGIIGHNCVLPEFRCRGLGRQQVLEILRRLQRIGVEKVMVSTCDHPFFIPSQRMYLACGFREVRRVSWMQGPGQVMIQYERDAGERTAQNQRLVRNGGRGYDGTP